MLIAARTFPGAALKVSKSEAALDTRDLAACPHPMLPAQAAAEAFAASDMRFSMHVALLFPSNEYHCADTDSGWSIVIGWKRPTKLSSRFLKSHATKLAGSALSATTQRAIANAYEKHACHSYNSVIRGNAPPIDTVIVAQETTDRHLTGSAESALLSYQPSQGDHHEEGSSHRFAVDSPG